MGRVFLKYWPLFFLALLEVFLFTLNFKAGTFFLGWDNLFPEMNFPANFQRSIFSVWQEYRGLGLPDGMSFAANLPHYIFLNLANFFLPLSLLRYLFIFLMHFLGGAGVYFLILELTGSSRLKPAALAGALFYLLNIGTVQMFFVPYEVFTVHFAFLPVLILTLLKYLKTNQRKHLAFFALASFLSVPQAHVPTLFIVYLLALIMILLYHLLLTGKKGLTKIGAVLTVIFFINAFWGLPYAYSVLANIEAVSNSKINQMSTEEIYLRNKAFGDLESVILMKGFSLDFVAGKGGGEYMMKPWRDHINKPAFAVIAFGFFGVILLGLGRAAVGKEKQFLPFAGMFLLAFLMLADDVPVIGGFSYILRSYIPFFDQIFRFTFTKFAVLYAFAAAVFFGLGVSFLLALLSSLSFLQKLSRVPILYPLPFTLFPCLLLMLLFYSLPAWQGNFLYSAQKLNIPGEYFELVDFFKSQPEGSRIALLPQTSFWGWTYTDWGYEGSGFIWYGLPQASLDGAFYPWSRENENYYWELTQAFFQKDRKMFESVLEKYQINWLVVDDSLQSPFSTDLNYRSQIQAVTGNPDKVSLVKKFDNLSVYQVKLSSNPASFVFLQERLPVVGPDYKWGSLDQGYLENGDYVSSLDSRLLTLDSFYPFRSLFTGRDQKELEFRVEVEGDYLVFRSMIPKQMAGSVLVMPALGSDQRLGSPRVYLDGELIQFDSLDAPLEVPLVNVTEGILEVKAPKVRELSAQVETGRLDVEPGICNQFNNGVFKDEKVSAGGKDYLKMISIGSDNCLNLNFPAAGQQWAYLVSIESSHVEGKSLNLAVINQASKRPELEVNLPKETHSTSYFIIPPMDYEGLGYAFVFNNVSFGRMKTVNSLGKITLNPIPYQFLKSLRVVKQTTALLNTPSINIKVDHPNPSLYLVNIPGGIEDNSTLVLSQSFDSGWKAYQINFQFSIFNFQLTNILPFIFGKEIKDHVLVNNWENGWLIPGESKQIVVVYLPQYLEYFGLLLLLAYPGWLVLRRLAAKNPLT